MRLYADLYYALDSDTKTNSFVEPLAARLRKAPPADAP